MLELQGANRGHPTLPPTARESWQVQLSPILRRRALHFGLWGAAHARIDDLDQPATPTAEQVRGHVTLSGHGALTGDSTEEYRLNQQPLTM